MYQRIQKKNSKNKKKSAEKIITSSEKNCNIQIANTSANKVRRPKKQI